MTQDKNTKTQGTLLRDAGGELYFISDETLAAARLSGDAATRVEKLLGEAGDVQGFAFGSALPTPLLRLDLAGLDLAINYNASKSNTVAPSQPISDGAAKGQATE